VLKLGKSAEISFRPRRACSRARRRRPAAFSVSRDLGNAPAAECPRLTASYPREKSPLADGDVVAGPVEESASRGAEAGRPVADGATSRVAYFQAEAFRSAVSSNQREAAAACRRPQLFPLLRRLAYVPLPGSSASAAGPSRQEISAQRHGEGGENFHATSPLRADANPADPCADSAARLTDLP